MLQYPWKPHETMNYRDIWHDRILTTWGSTSTLEEGKKLRNVLVQYVIDYYLPPQINDVIHQTIQNADLTDPLTQSLATSRIPASANNENTKRFLIAFMYEKEIGYNDIVLSTSSLTHHPGRNFEYIAAITNMYKLYTFVINCTKRADKIVEIMQDAATKVGDTLARTPDRIREAALIDLGEKTGLEVTSKANAIGFSFGERDNTNNIVTYRLEPNKSFLMERVQGLRVVGRRANNTDTVILTAKNGPSEITVTPISTGSVGKSVLAKDASRTLTNLELTSNVVSTQPIITPTATKELPDITDLEVGESQSVNLTGLFTGIRVNITITSSDETKATINHVANTTTMSVSAVAAGTATITVTGTNEAGNVSVDFDVTVIAAEE